jgi:hypothetical protein
MMSQNIEQIYVANPITTNVSTDLMYFGQSPYGPSDDAAMTFANFSAQFVPFAGGATAGKILRSNGTDWVASTSTFADTYAASTLLYASGTNTVAGLATANGAVLVTSNTGVPVYSSTMTNGQLIIGSTGATPVSASLTAGIGVSISTGAGSITINATGAGLAFVSVAGTIQTAVANTTYALNNAGATTVTLPTTASSTLGDTIKIKGASAAPWIIQANTGQVISFGSVSSTAAGTATSAAGTNSMQLMYIASNLWSVDWALSSGIILA